LQAETVGQGSCGNSDVVRRTAAPGESGDPFVRQRLFSFGAKRSGEDLHVLKELIQAGKVAC
jgi:hypothetical protein